MLKDLFSKKSYVTINMYEGQRSNVKDNVKANEVPTGPIKGSPQQPGPQRIGPRERIAELIDMGTFIEYDIDVVTGNPLAFPNYEAKLSEAMATSKEKEAVITGEGRIAGEACVVAVMNSCFMMGSMGIVVGEKLTRAVEAAIEKELPIIIFTASGGARMQEGILSLMQMAKISGSLAMLSEKGLLYISVLTDPTTGGVTASFAMQGDIIIAEPGALIGFAGPRVIEQTIKQKLPEGFQRAEFLLDKGFIDRIVSRSEMRKVLGQILTLHSNGGELLE